MRTFAAYLEWDPDTQLYVGFVPGIAEPIPKAKHSMNSKRT